MNTFSLNPMWPFGGGGGGAPRTGESANQPVDRFSREKCLGVFSLSLSLALSLLYACNYWRRTERKRRTAGRGAQRMGDGMDARSDSPSLADSVTAPKMRAFESKFMGSGGPIERKREIEGSEASPI